MATVAFHTLGCKLNFSETSAMSRKMQEVGFERVEFDQKADMYVINTCSVTEEANKKCRQMIGRCRRLNGEAYIVVTGCYAQLEAEQVAQIEGVSLVLGSNEKTDILHYIDHSLQRPAETKVVVGKILKDRQFKPSFSSGDRTRSFLKVQDGCNYFCTYCTIPMARGTSRSATLDDAIAEAQCAANMGAKEIILTGVNIGEFGKNTGSSLLELVERLEQVEGVERYRISSIEPNLLTEDIIKHVAQPGSKFMPHFHVPLQCGSNKVLELMHRRYTAEFFKEKIDLIHKYIPDVFIGIDVIVGTNGETDELFEESRSFIEGLDYSQLHVFTYSERPGTQALKITPVVPNAERHRRNGVLHAMSEQKHADFLDRYVGTEAKVLVESVHRDGKTYGFTENYIKVELPYDADKVNTIQRVKLLEREGDFVKGAWCE